MFISGLVLGVPVVLISLGGVGLLWLRDPLRWLTAMVLIQAGGLLLLVELAALHAGIGPWPSEALTLFGLHLQPVAAAAEGSMARLHGLGLAVILLGLAWQVMLVAVLLVLKQRTGALQPSRLAALAAAEWQAILGEESPAKAKVPTDAKASTSATGEHS